MDEPTVRLSFESHDGGKQGGNIQESIMAKFEIKKIGMCEKILFVNAGMYEKMPWKVG